MIVGDKVVEDVDVVFIYLSNGCVLGKACVSCLEIVAVSRNLCKFCIDVCVFIMSRGALLCVRLLESYMQKLPYCHHHHTMANSTMLQPPNKCCISFTSPR